jgi:hypothetical protein
MPALRPSPRREGRHPTTSTPWWRISPRREVKNLAKLSFALDHSLGLVVEGGDDLVGVLFRVVKSQAADGEIDDFMTVPRSRQG